MPSNPGPRLVATWRCISEHGQCCHLSQIHGGPYPFFCDMMDLPIEPHTLTPTSCPFHPYTTAEPGMIERAERVSRGYVRDALDNYPL
jgi:hypothetical protein